MALDEGSSKTRLLGLQHAAAAGAIGAVVDIDVED